MRNTSDVVGSRRFGRTFTVLGLALLVFASIITVAHQEPAYALGNYSRPAAVAYADQWALSRNPNLPSFGNDCTNFVSQVLDAGRYPSNGTLTSNYTCNPTVWWYPYQDPNSFVWYYTYSWINADCMRQMFQNRPQDFQLQGVSPVYLQGGGDILQMADDPSYPTTPMHSRILLGPGYDSVDGLYYQNLEDQHTNDQYRRRWDLNIDPSWMLWPWLVTW